jgi:hypothetical protein
MITIKRKVDFPNGVGSVVPPSVMIRCATGIATKLLIESPYKGLSAIETFLFRNIYGLFRCKHNVFVIIKYVTTKYKNLRFKKQNSVPEE